VASSRLFGRTCGDASPVVAASRVHTENLRTARHHTIRLEELDGRCGWLAGQTAYQELAGFGRSDLEGPITGRDGANLL
jgi:hypothetical protein